MQTVFKGYPFPLAITCVRNPMRGPRFRGSLIFDDHVALWRFIDHSVIGWQSVLTFDEAVEYLVLRSAPRNGGCGMKLDVDLEVRDGDGVRIPVRVLRDMFSAAEALVRRERRERYLSRRYPDAPFRGGPVSGIGKGRFRYARHSDRVMQEVSANEFLEYEGDCVDYRIRARRERGRKTMTIPWWGDHPRRRGVRNWKATREKQWKARTDDGHLRNPDGG